MLVFEPLLPIGLWLGLALAAVVALGVYAFSLRGRLGAVRRVAVLALMTLAVALPLGILLNPQWVERLPPPAGKPVLTVLVDRSASMATPDGPEGRTRLQQAEAIAADLERRLADRFELRLRQFSVTAGPLNLQDAPPADGRRTDLAAALGAALDGDRPQGQAVLLVSDGIHNSGGDGRVLDSARRAKAMAAPVYTQTVGGQSHVRDLAVEVRSPQELGFVRQRVPLRASVESEGLAGNVDVVLTLDNREVERRSVALTPDKATSVEFSVGHDTSGIYHYDVSIEPLGQEVTAANNSATFLLRVIDEPIRVLLLEGKPYWDTKFLLRTLADDPSLDLTSVVRLANQRLLERRLTRASSAADSGATDNNPEQKKAGDEPAETATAQPATAAAPAADNKSAPAADKKSRSEAWQILNPAEPVLASTERLSEFQIVILGRDAEIFLTDEALDRLKRWLARDGGSLVCFRGAPTAQANQRLSQMLPVRWEAGRESRFHMQFTDDGRALGWLAASPNDADVLTRLPTLATHAQPGRTQPLATILATGELSSGSSTPVVTSLPFGTGRVVAVEGAGMWRWAFLAPQYHDQEQVYRALWHSLTRWLVSSAGLLPSQSWALRSEKVRFDTNEEAALTLLVRPDRLTQGVPAVELLGSGSTEPKTLVPAPSGDDPGAFRVGCGRLPAGRYTATIVGSRPDDAAAHTVFDVRESVEELTHLDANPSLMRRVAETSGGAVLDSGSPAEVAARVDEHLARSRPEQVRSTSAWDRWWVLAGVLALWSLAWGVRRSSGLI